MRLAFRSTHQKDGYRSHVTLDRLTCYAVAGGATHPAQAGTRPLSHRTRRAWLPRRRAAARLHAGGRHPGARGAPQRSGHRTGLQPHPYPLVSRDDRRSFTVWASEFATSPSPVVSLSISPTHATRRTLYVSTCAKDIPWAVQADQGRLLRGESHHAGSRGWPRVRTENGRGWRRATPEEAEAMSWSRGDRHCRRPTPHGDDSGPMGPRAAGAASAAAGTSSSAAASSSGPTGTMGPRARDEDSGDTADDSGVWSDITHWEGGLWQQHIPSGWWRRIRNRSREHKQNVHFQDHDHNPRHHRAHSHSSSHSNISREDAVALREEIRMLRDEVRALRLTGGPGTPRRLQPSPCRRQPP